MPPAARGPVFTVSRPILSGTLCAIEGMGKTAAPAAAVAPATKRRRVVLMTVMASSRGSAVLMQPEFLDAGSCGRNSIIMLRRSEPPTITYERSRQALQKSQTPRACVRDYRLGRRAQLD